MPTKDSDDIYNQNYTCLTLISSRYLVNIVRVFALIVHISLEVISCNFSFVEHMFTNYSVFHDRSQCSFKLPEEENP